MTTVDEPVADLFRREKPGLLRLAALLVGDTAQAEDVVQDAFVAVHRRWDHLDHTTAAGYLRVAVVNGSRTVHRARARLARHLTRTTRDQDAPAADTALLVAEEHREVLRAVRRLPRRQREVLVLRYWSGLSEAEIAATLGVSRGTVKTSASRALATLHRRLGAHRD
ncbi:SigE family RNA polymerase sigma factor [Actinosynnema sp. NPDC020468]|uniref:RNA polymerase sigma factor n=1 Tax=Actinosynnema sp. NPDC020468 TaxID=3154488 RepID=UPI0033D079AA